MNNSAAPASNLIVPTAGTETLTHGPRSWYWVAINGDSAAMAPYPLPITVNCTPTPQLLIGLKTFIEAKTLQSLLLPAPMKVARKELGAIRRNPEAVCIVPENPEPPTRGATFWSVA
jgi:hypothetical protein